MSDILVHIDTNPPIVWFDDVPSFPPQAVVGVISGVLNSRNTPAFTATSKSTVCTYVYKFIYEHNQQVCSILL